ncbi:MAG: hypothetical protein HY699_14305 [Deltaproteobacteria bacterium]|nr:hypothetical protein [Deltaproteobacteria bacterium]
MACEFFSDGKYPLCLAVRGLMTPSLAQMRRCCASEHPEACPFFQSYHDTGEKVPLEVAKRGVSQRRLSA